MGATGSGRQPTPRWARRGWGDLIGPNPTDRATPGVKRSLLVEADGGPLAVVIAGANVPDAQLLAKTIEAVVLERPPVEDGWPQHLCLDQGYDNEEGWGACVDHEYDPHIALIRDDRPTRPEAHKPRRWVVERTLARLSKAEQSSSAGTRSPRTTSACSSSPVPSSGFAGSGAWSLNQRRVPGQVPPPSLR